MLINTDQNCAIDPNANQNRSTATNVDQIFSILLNKEKINVIADQYRIKQH